MADILQGNEMTSDALPLPDKVSGWPTPWISQGDLETYVLPLYSRGWGVTFAGTPSKRNARLSKLFRFDGFLSALQFVNEIANICHDENVACVPFQL
jgi:hypothetical protein